MSGLELGALVALVVVTALLWPQPGPALANPLTDASAISASVWHTCALTTGGGAKCWGYNADGQLGDGSTKDRTTPVDVSGLTSGVLAVGTGGYHSCVLTADGGVKCWGYNEFGQLGDGGACGIFCGTPVDVSGLTSGVTAISTGFYHTCALTTAGGIKCWGANGSGQLGDGLACGLVCPEPVDVSGLTSGVSAVSAGSAQTCALTTGAGVKCWGNNASGELGDGTATHRLTPVDVLGLTNGVAEVSTGSGHSCAVTTDGGVKCWGANGYGQLGDGTATKRSTPVDVVGLLSGVSVVSAGAGHTCALTTAGGIKCWGSNGLGQLGDGLACGLVCPAPVEVSGLTSGITAVSASQLNACALTTGGGVKCWGYNNKGQLGDGTTTNRDAPVEVVISAKSTPTATVTLTPTLTPTRTVTLTATPTPTHPPRGGVGGVTEPAGNSATGASMALAVALAGVLALSGVAWYTRRRLRG